MIKKTRFTRLIVILIAIWAALAPYEAVPTIAGEPDKVPKGAHQGSVTIHLPVIALNYPYLSPFGVESTVNYQPGGFLLNRLIELEAGSVRINGQISWRDLQPNENDPIDWSIVANFDDSLRSLKAAGITPVVIVDDYPRWSTINEPWPTACGAIRADKFGAFAQFLTQVVNRYKTPEFDVHIWELGNEPDVDPNLVQPDNMFGCWGNRDDPYYGGVHYGEMLKVATPAIKAADPTAQVWIGGLLLDSPNTLTDYPGKPENFLRGILQAGAAPYFDAVPYHWYPPYANIVIDHDYILWKDQGGGTVGKARFLRSIMAEYGVSKPLHLNETGLMCPEKISGQDVLYCLPSPVPEFYDMQANHLVRSFVRGLNERISSFSWYTLEGPGWRHTGLLNNDGSPKPVYSAYKVLNQQLKNTRLLGPSYFGDGIEAYAFKHRDTQVHVLWAKEDINYSVSIPATRYLAAYDRTGQPIAPSFNGVDVEFEVGFDPIYLSLRP